MAITTDLSEIESMSERDLMGVISTLQHRNEELLDELHESHSMSQVQLAIDDLGWRPLGNISGSPDELNLDKIKEISDLCRALVTVNPLVKRGVAIRSGYIWGRGVEISNQGNIVGRPSSTLTLPPAIMDIFGTTVSQLELERTAAADGNMFFLLDTRGSNRRIDRVPLSQISGAVTESGNNENILYFKRTWNNQEIDLGTGAPQMGAPQEERWYPSSKFVGTPRSEPISNVMVDPSKRMVHIAFNKMVGWRWGVPDIFAVVFWVKAYKEYLENCATLTKAYARFAWKVTSATGKGQQRVASQLASTPSRDPATGQPLAVGGSVALGSGQDLQAVQRSNSVDFDGGRALAALIAAGLEVPLTALTSDPSDGNRATAETLDDPTKLAMLARQQMMDDAFQEIFRIMNIRAVVSWPDIAPEPLHRRVQAIDMAGRSGTFTGDEWRSMLKDALGDKWKDLPTQVPDLENMPLILKNQADPNQGAPAQVDPPSRGDHELRDQGGQAHTEET